MSKKRPLRIQNPENGTPSLILLIKLLLKKKKKNTPYEPTQKTKMIRKRHSSCPKKKRRKKSFSNTEQKQRRCLRGQICGRWGTVQRWDACPRCSASKRWSAIQGKRRLWVDWKGNVDVKITTGKKFGSCVKRKREHQNTKFVNRGERKRGNVEMATIEKTSSWVA